LFEYTRNNALDSLGYFDQVSHGGSGSVAPYRRNQFGGALGGPIKKDRTFFFVTYESLRQGNGLNISAEVPTAATRQGILPVGIVKGTPSERYCLSGAPTCTVPVSPVIKPYLDLFHTPNSPAVRAGTAFFIPAPLQV